MMIGDGSYKQRGDGIKPGQCIFRSEVRTRFWEDAIWIVVEGILLATKYCLQSFNGWITVANRVFGCTPTYLTL